MWVPPLLHCRNGIPGQPGVGWLEAALATLTLPRSMLPVAGLESALATAQCHLLSLLKAVKIKSSLGTHTAQAASNCWARTADTFCSMRSKSSSPALPANTLCPPTPAQLNSTPAAYSRFVLR